MKKEIDCKHCNYVGPYTQKAMKDGVKSFKVCPKCGGYTPLMTKKQLRDEVVTARDRLQKALDKDDQTELLNDVKRHIRTLDRISLG
jgi:adenylate kinase